MTRIARSAVALVVLLLLAACAPREPVGATPPTPSTPPGPEFPAEGLVLQVSHTGGFTTPQLLASRLPLVSIYADGRVLTQGPQIMIYPSPALPNLRVQHIDEDAVRALAERALEAGVAGSADLGSPPVADAASTRFTVVTQDGTHVREVYALGAAAPPGPPDGDRSDGTDTGLTPEQEAARAELAELVQTLSDPSSVLPPEAVGEAEPYTPEAIAGVVTEWTDPQTDVELRPVPWPGPPLPGEPLHERLGVSCVVARGAQTEAILAAARGANQLTPWVSDDGRRWSVALRPLLPHENGCADLLET